MYDVGGKLLSRITFNNVNILVCVRVKGVRVSGLGWIIG